MYSEDLELGGEHARTGPQLCCECGAEARVQAGEEEEEDNARLDRTRPQHRRVSVGLTIADCKGRVMAAGRCGT